MLKYGFASLWLGLAMVAVQASESYTNVGGGVGV